jgi:DNA-binding XRE family transcriptional regulator
MKARRFPWWFVHTFVFITSSDAQKCLILFELIKNKHYGMKHSIMNDKVNKAIKPLTSAQMRAARGLIRWSAEDLARETALSVTTIRRAELTDVETSMTTANDLAVRRALEAAGVMFIDENGGGGPGVRLRKQP